MIKLIYNLIFREKNKLNAVNLPSNQSFSPFGEVVIYFSTSHFRGSEVVMLGGNQVEMK